MFHGLAPRVRISELAMPLPCPEPCFRAGNAEELLVITHKIGARSVTSSSTVRDLIGLLCDEDERSEKMRDLTGLPVLGLFTLITGKC